jgi:hypothetical protein
LIAIVRSKSSSVRSSSPRTVATPALLIRTPIDPSSAATCRTIASTAGRLETSAPTAIARRPPARMLSTTSAACRSRSW